MALDASQIFAFSQGVLAARYDNAQPTPGFHMDLWTLCCSDDQFVALAAPRGHAKSTSVTNAYLLSKLLFRESKYAVVVSNTEGQARNFLKNITVELMENEEIQRLFKPRMVKDTDTDIIVALGDGTHKFRLEAKGSNQKVRGMLWRGTRPDLIVCDDMENDDIVMNEERRAKFRDWFFNALIPCLSDHGQLRVVGTILHMDSLLERLMPKADPLNGVNLIHTPLADFTDEKDPLWKSVRFRAHDPSFEHILWPEKFSKERLMKIRANYIAQGNPDGYAQEYLNFPIDESQSYIRPQDLLPMDAEDILKYEQGQMKFYVGCDFAITKKSYSDYTAFPVIGVDEKGIFHLVDVRMGRWDTYEIVDEMFSIYDRYGSDIVFFPEKGAIWEAIKPVLLKESISRDKVRSINFDLVSCAADKQIRARPFQHRTRAGAFKILTTASWYVKVRDQILHFPRGANDDVVDGIGNVCQKILELARAPTGREIAEREFRKSYKMSGRKSGRSRLTGY